MALNILSDLAAWREVAYDRVEDAPDGSARYRLKSTAEAFVVYGSMMVGMDVLDEKTAPEYLARLRAWEIIDGPMLYAPGDDGLAPVPVTMEHLRPFFGTRTNNFPAESNAKFAKRIAEAVMNRARNTAQ